jgi:hypothetical protein
MGKYRLTSDARQDIEKNLMKAVVCRWAKIFAIVVPAPLVAIVPIRERVLEARDALLKPACNLGVAGFDHQVVQAEQGNAFFSQPR